MKETMRMKRPVIGITMGDPCGVGPEIVVKALTHPEIYEVCRPVVIGDSRVLRQAMVFCGIEEGRILQESDGIVDLNNAEALPLGQVQAAAGRAAYEYIETAVRMAQRGEIDAVATAPIHKEALRAAGIDYIGHTEIFAGLTQRPDPLTMFETRGMRVFFLTRHVSLRQACDMVTEDRILNYIARCCQSLKDLGVAGGILAVAGLNPHSGEHGLFGNEDTDIIAPAVSKARSAGWRAEGPVSADSVFHWALQGRFAGVLSMYHDQGHIAAKTLDFERTVAVTLGLPFLRTSVDHGTAMDIAGQGIASEISMAEAIKVAAAYAATTRL
jgi:4-hydroxythreonine-4-phosphate dehydrogenase